MKKRENKITVITGFSLLIILLLAQPACKPNTAAEIEAVASKEEQPSLIVNDLETIISDSGFIKYKVVTPELLEFDVKAEPYTEFPKGLTITSLDKTLKMNAEIKGNYAKYLKKKKLWLLRNNVQAINYEGNIINTEELYWDMNTHKIYSDKFIKITSAKEIITGVGFEGNEDFSKYKILNINGIVELQE